MIVSTLSILLFIIFLILASIHLYWVFGGKWGLKNAIPTKEKSTDVNFKPSNIATLIVALVLFSFACFYFIQTNLISYRLPKWTRFILWFLPSIFLLRAIGDFKYVGFFKKITSTLFAKWDRILFTPLCLIISLIGYIINLLN